MVFVGVLLLMLLFMDCMCELLVDLFGKVECMVLICFGVFLLVEVGLLDGCCVMMYWVFFDWFRDCYFVVLVEKDCIFVCDGMLWSLVGMSMVMDMVFVMFEEDFGLDVVL